jgi:hypothetical protein
MTKYLITPSLLGSFAWYLSDESEDSRNKFLQTLGKVKTPTTPAQQKGIDFENNIKQICDENLFDSQEEVIDSIPRHELEIADIVDGGLWQQSVKKELKIGNTEFLLYGRTDVIKRDTVYDIKFTSNYELGKFLDSSQHLIYLYCTGLPKFQYLISDGKDYWIEDYNNHAGVEDEIKGKISDFMSYLDNDLEAKEIFLTKWEAK